MPKLPFQNPPNLIKPDLQYKNGNRATYLIDKFSGEKFYKCPVCSKLLKGHVSSHLRTHSGNKPWSCRRCDKSFVQRCNLRTHMELRHRKSRKKPFTCELCCKTFNYKKDMEKHISLHLGETPFKCEFCEKRYCSDDGLTKHRRSHTGETRYECVFCTKKFSLQATFARHLKVHIEERPYSCEDCDWSFYDLASLRAHRVKNHDAEGRDSTDNRDSKE